MICGTASDFAFVPHDAEAALSRLSGPEEGGGRSSILRLRVYPYHPGKPQCHALGQSDRAQQAGSAEKWQKDLIARVFDCPVANEYGARDAGILAYTCPSGGIHITAENCIIEVLDPVTYEPVLNGQSGVLAELDRTAPEHDTAASRGDAIPAETAPSCRLTAKMHVSSI